MNNRKPERGSFDLAEALLALALLIILALLLASCTAAGTALTVQGGLSAASSTVEAYCALAPEGRAELRERTNLPHLIACPNDPAVSP